MSDIDWHKSVKDRVGIKSYLWYQNQGFSFSQDENGNLFFTCGGTYSESSIQLVEVVVNGVRYTKDWNYLVLNIAS